jgi:hypothetical protein
VLSVAKFTFPESEPIKELEINALIILKKTGVGMLARADSIRVLRPDFQVPFLGKTFSFKVSAI